MKILVFLLRDHRIIRKPLWTRLSPMYHLDPDRSKIASKWTLESIYNQQHSGFWTPKAGNKKGPGIYAVHALSIHLELDLLQSCKALSTSSMTSQHRMTDHHESWLFLRASCLHLSASVESIKNHKIMVFQTSSSPSLFQNMGPQLIASDASAYKVEESTLDTQNLTTSETENSKSNNLDLQCLQWVYSRPVSEALKLHVFQDPHIGSTSSSSSISASSEDLARHCQTGKIWKDAVQKASDGQIMSNHVKSCQIMKQQSGNQWIPNLQHSWNVFKHLEVRHRSARSHPGHSGGTWLRRPGSGKSGGPGPRLRGSRASSRKAAYSRRKRTKSWEKGEVKGGEKTVCNQHRFPSGSSAMRQEFPMVLSEAEPPRPQVMNKDASQ